MNGEEFKAGVAKLKPQKPADARKAYREVYGMPPFTEDEWTKFDSRCKSNKLKYEAKDYGR